MTIVLGYDGGETARTALDEAIRLSIALSEPLLVVCGVGPAGGLGEEYGEVSDALSEVLAPTVAEGVAKAAAAGVGVESLILDMAPAEAILAAATDTDCSMIVVGSGPHGRIRSALFGAVAYRVLDETEVPVLVVP